MMDRNTPELIDEQRERIRELEAAGRISEYERGKAIESLDGPRGDEAAILFSELTDYQLAMVVSLYHGGLLGTVTSMASEFIGAGIPD